MAESQTSRGVFSGQNNMLFFFLLLAVIFCKCPAFKGSGDSLLFFFLLVIVLFGGTGFFGC